MPSWYETFMGANNTATTTFIPLYSEVTRDIRVSVKPEFLEQESNLEQGVYAFSYTVSIENHGLPTVQLLKRQWRVFSAGSLYTEVEGEGVVGVQPVLRTGEGFTYTSWSVIKDSTGSMIGAYSFASETGEVFDVGIPEFDLVHPDSLH